MIRFAFRVYALVAILAPWAFLIVRWLGLYNHPHYNSWIFLGLFTFSGVVMFCSYKKW